MEKNALEIVGGIAWALIWIFSRVGWKLKNIVWFDNLPLLERLMAAVIMIGWTVLVEAIFRYGSG